MFFDDLILIPDAVSPIVVLIETNAGCVGIHADLVYATDGKVQLLENGSSKELIRRLDARTSDIVLEKENL